MECRYTNKLNCKMNQENLAKVQKAILDRPLSGIDRYVLWFKNGEFLCRPYGTNINAGCRITFLNARMLKDGLSAKEWNMLFHKLQSCMKESKK